MTTEAEERINQHVKDIEEHRDVKIPECCPKCNSELVFQKDKGLEEYHCTNSNCGFKFNPKKEAWKKCFSDLKPTKLPQVHMNCTFCKNIYTDQCTGTPNPDTCTRYEENKQISHAEKIVLLIDRKSPTFFKEQYKNIFVWIKDNNIRKTLNVQSQEFEQICRDLFFRTFGKVTKRENIKDALATFEAISRKNQTIKLRTRIANVETEKGLEIWVDLCNKNYESIKITKDGYTIESETPPLFRRYEHMAALQYPKDGKDSKDDMFQNFLTPLPPYIKSKNRRRGEGENSCKLPSLLSLRYLPFIFNYLRVPEEDRLLILVALVSYFFLGVPFVIIYVHGESGKGKTFGSKCIQEIVDPTTTEVLGLPKKSEELLQNIDHRFFVSFDNISYISDEFSDIFCRVSTGCGISKRKLYTDDSDFYRVLKRPLWFNGISVEITREDMLKRTILSEALPLDGEKRAESEINQEIKTLTPYIQHELYTLISKVIGLLPNVKPSKLFRMADYTKIGCAVAEALGYDQQLFIDTYQAKITEQTKELIWNNTVGSVLYDYIFSQSTNSWKETPTQLFKHIRKHAKGEMGVSTNQRGFPKSPPHLTRKINLLLEPFKKIGVELVYHKGAIREWEIINHNVKVESEQLEESEDLETVKCFDCGKSLGIHEFYKGNDMKTRCRDCNAEFLLGRSKQ